MSEIRVIASRHSGYVKVERSDEGFNVELDLGRIEANPSDTPTWVSLQPDEARAVAAALIHQASEAESR